VVMNTGLWWMKPDADTIKNIRKALPDARFLGFGPYTAGIMNMFGGPSGWYILVESESFTWTTPPVIFTSALFREPKRIPPKGGGGPIIA